MLILQRVLRGRAYQNRMFEGKEKRLDLIEELRAAEHIMTSVRRQDVELKQELQARLIADDTEDYQIGTIVSETLDALSKELEKLEELRRIDAMVALAQRDRRMRQAAEGGRRQAEQRIRAREDEAFRQIMKGAHQVPFFARSNVCSKRPTAAHLRMVGSCGLHNQIMILCRILRIISAGFHRKRPLLCCPLCS